MKSRIVQPAASFQPPETCTEHEECQAAQASPEELRVKALEHYERITTSAHEWYSVISNAINAYFDNLVPTTHVGTCTCCGKVECDCGPYKEPNSKVIDDPCRICGKCINHCPHQ